jgi:hypothetical protein
MIDLFTRSELVKIRDEMKGERSKRGTLKEPKLSKLIKKLDNLLKD